VVGTESGIDLGKSLSTYVHHWLELPPGCRSFEVKQACYGGTAALQVVAALVGASPMPGSLALVIATDATGPAARGGYVEPSEGAGAVAMLVGTDAAILELDAGACGFHTFEVMDTLRPRADLDVVDADLSLLAYLTCLKESFGGYRDRVRGADFQATFDYLVFHTPFAGMVRGAHRMMMREQAALPAGAIDADFDRRVAPSLAYCSQVGNLFSATLYLALCSLIETSGLTGPHRVGLYSYGSGCAAEFFSGVIPGGAAATLAGLGIGAALRQRQRLTVPEYDVLDELAAARCFGTRDARFDPAPYQGLYARQFEGRGLLALDRITGFHREYRWS
jgi:polyketide biosynthesis 3-hydroxy-3-methylglutaryl-CoA synthase-like enzyme PksG